MELHTSEVVIAAHHRDMNPIAAAHTFESSHSWSRVALLTPALYECQRERVQSRSG